MAFGFYKSVTLSEAQSGTADSTDWPLAIALDGNVQAADADLKTVGNGGYVENANGYDIRPYADSGLTSALTYELVYYDGSTGKLEMHVKIPTLSTSTDTVIYLAFGDSGISADGSSTGTWNGNFKSVWHMGDGSTATGNDSTSNNNDLTLGTNTNAATGEIVGGGNTNFPGTPSSATFGANFSLALTLSVWLNISQNASTTFGSIGGNITYHPRPSVVPRLTFNGVADYDFSTLTFPTTGWVFMTVSISGNNGTAVFYVCSGGTVNSESLSVGTPNALNANLDFSASFFEFFDEVRTSNAVRNSSWVTADYNSQKASSTFITWGARTAAGGGGGPVGPYTNPDLKALLQLGIGT